MGEAKMHLINKNSASSSFNRIVTTFKVFTIRLTSGRDAPIYRPIKFYLIILFNPYILIIKRIVNLYFSGFN